MNAVQSLLKEVCLDAVHRIDNGDCNISEQGAKTLISCIREVTNMQERISKYDATQYLNISRATFDLYVRTGKLPKGEHKRGFKELSWRKKDLEEFIKNNKSKV